MIPSALVAQLEQGLRDFLLSSFSSTTPGFDTAIERLLAEPGRLVKGPFVQVALPFVRGSRSDWVPRVPLPFTPHKHQELAFARLGGATKLSTLIATGTGSGKSESFLWPILAHCEAHPAEPGPRRSRGSLGHHERPRLHCSVRNTIRCTHSQNRADSTIKEALRMA